MFPVLPAFRGRDRMNRALQAGVLFVLLLRGLLSGVVMFDHAPGGDFGLVLCSGAGAMFFTAPDATDAAASMSALDAGATGNMRGMDGMASMASARTTVPMQASHAFAQASAAQTAAAPHADQSIEDGLATQARSTGAHSGMPLSVGMDSGVCAFSAALCVAIVALTAVALRLSALRAPPIRPARSIGHVVRRMAYRFALSRAPPFRSMLP